MRSKFHKIFNQPIFFNKINAGDIIVIKELTLLSVLTFLSVSLFAKDELCHPIGLKAFGVAYDN